MRDRTSISVTISQEQYDFLKRERVVFSKLMQRRIDELMDADKIVQEKLMRMNEIIDDEKRESITAAENTAHCINKEVES